MVGSVGPRPARSSSSVQLARGRAGGRTLAAQRGGAIAAIENERATFYVEWSEGHRLDVVVGQGLGKQFHRTESDGESPDILLALPDCG